MSCVRIALRVDELCDDEIKVVEHRDNQNSVEIVKMMIVMDLLTVTTLIVFSK